MWVRFKLLLWGMCIPLLISPATGQEAVVATPAPAPPTLWNFLGIPQGARKVHGALFNTRGNHPNIEKKPPLKAIGDPANLKSQNEAIKQAAKVKQEEDLKPQKIKAIKYLASIGCGCYDKDGEITKALIAAAEDCTEEVRLTTVQELLNLACGKCCSKCGMSCCCKEPMLKKMAEIAYGKDEFGCYVEPSARVRQVAAQVLQACCPSPIPPVVEPEKKPEEEPPPPKKKKLPPIVPEAPKPDAEEVPGEKPNTDSDDADEKKSDAEKKSELKDAALRHFNDRMPARLTSSTPMRLTPNRPAPIVNPDMELTSSPNPDGGVVIGYDPQNALAYVHFEDPGMIVPVGSSVYVQVDPARGSGFRGSWKVVASAKGRANLVPEDSDAAYMLLPGDHVMFGDPPVSVTPVLFMEK